MCQLGVGNQGAARGRRLLATLIAAVVCCGVFSAGSAGAATSPLKWSTPQVIDQIPVDAPVSISCPDAGDCFALDGQGDVLSTTTPTAATQWSRVHAGVNGSLDCPSTSLCVALDGQVIKTTTTPTAATPWTTTTVTGNGGNDEQGIACPSAQLCIAIDQALNVQISTDPTGGRSAWSVSQIRGGADTDSLTNLSCPDAGLCVALDQDSQTVIWSTNPTAGASTWQTGTFPSGGNLAMVDCVSDQLCFAAAGGRLWDSADPGAGPSSWHQAFAAGTGFKNVTGVSCASADSCLAVTSSGSVWATSNPLGGASAWATTATARDTLGTTDTSCFSAGFCFVYGNSVDPGDDQGPFADDNPPNTDLAVSPAPSSTSPVPAWTEVPVYSTGAGLTALTCPSTALCVALDEFGDVLTSTNATARSPKWTERDPDDGGDPTAVACPSAHLCVMADDTGDVLSSTAPASGKWKNVLVDEYDDQDDGPSNGSLTAIGCASVKLCWTTDPDDGFGGEYGGLWYRSTAPAKDSWKLTQLWNTSSNDDGTTEQLGGYDITCPAASMCLGTGYDASGDSLQSDVWRAGHPKPVIVGAFGGRLASCGGTTLCAVTGPTKLSASRTPAVRGSWHTVSLEPKGQTLGALDCPSTGSCMVGDSVGRIGVSSTPAGPVTSWRFTTVDAGNGFTALSCLSARLCVALDSDGRALVGRR